MKNKLSILLFGLFLSCNLFSQTTGYPIVSPDKKMVMNIDLQQPEGKLTYSLNFDGKPVVLSSKFSITCNGKAWESKLAVQCVNEQKKDTTWKPVYGERAVIRDNYTEKTFKLTKADHAQMGISLTIRAYNEGIAFRYNFSETDTIYGTGPFHLSEELTEYTFAENTMAWHTLRAQTPHNLLPLKNWPGESDRPLVLQLPNGLYACLTEAQMTNYVRTKFKLSADKPNTITGSMYGTVDELPPFSTPWRVIMVAHTPGELLQNNDLILNLNKPCEIKNTAWIKPGKVMREMSLSTEGAKKAVDFCAEHNIQYLDLTFWNGDDITYNASKPNVSAWRSAEPYDMFEIIRYAKANGVGIWLYVNQRPLTLQLDSLLPLYHQWGINGIKFGFVHVGSHRWTVWLHEAIRKCAKYEIMADIHDEYRPTGFSRTYPNLLTQEGVSGNEGMPDAINNTILPFTRYIAGAADYTICYYARKEFRKSGRYIKNTPAHQLALPVIYYSPLQYLFWYDTPDKYQGEPEIAFWDELPTVWDDTKVLCGEIGKYISIARKSGDKWFIGSITNTEARELKIPLSFLDKGKKYEATIYSDDPKVNTRTHVAIEKRGVNAKTELTLKLDASGGQAILLKPASSY
ncbi:MAG: alpha-glucosidase [Bacteroidetes bacterium GWF2_42_66]|nr:MAG: alpha-glucosidase [Bacteroidetes bacterium GWA2_42_15]OFX98900.1 MAG: alpha-glucosidase [Bacteroidetes bacterium GWE2_42_39]OFY45615.1 MAG: alpha-glucosidase [Bacteroidetes bacterium GWF2_42_66]HBL77405.1 alpha-glucosidase [Prolixibacteraceae bacterium]HCU62431.1 alpha-glucosidase [Prolixibacteraceae bacterium]